MNEPAEALTCTFQSLMETYMAAICFKRQQAPYLTQARTGTHLKRRHTSSLSAALASCTCSAQPLQTSDSLACPCTAQCQSTSHHF